MDRAWRFVLHAIVALIATVAFGCGGDDAPSPEQSPDESTEVRADDWAASIADRCEPVGTSLAVSADSATTPAARAVALQGVARQLKRLATFVRTSPSPDAADAMTYATALDDMRGTLSRYAGTLATDPTSPDLADQLGEFQVTQRRLASAATSIGLPDACALAS